MEINEMAKRVYENAKSKGWHELDRSALEIHALIHSEISEATEEVRISAPPIYFKDILNPLSDDSVLFTDENGKALKPEGEAIELADAVIRIMDYFVAQGWDLEKTIEMKHQYNKTRSIRHGGKIF